MLARIANRVKAGRATICQPGGYSYHAISRIRIKKVIRKSTNATTTVAVGTINLGKYTLLMRFALLIRLLEASLNPVEKNVRQHAGENHQGIRRCSVRQQPGDAAKYHVKTIIVINGANDRPCAD